MAAEDVEHRLLPNRPFEEPMVLPFDRSYEYCGLGPAKSARSVCGGTDLRYSLRF
jgi:hypothetical protein